MLRASTSLHHVKIWVFIILSLRSSLVLPCISSKTCSSPKCRYAWASHLRKHVYKTIVEQGNVIWSRLWIVQYVVGWARVDGSVKSCTSGSPMCGKCVHFRFAGPKIHWNVRSFSRTHWVTLHHSCVCSVFWFHGSGGWKDWVKVLRNGLPRYILYTCPNRKPVITFLFKKKRELRGKSSPEILHLLSKLFWRCLKGDKIGRENN